MRFHKYECMKCHGFKTYSIIKFAKHIKKEHNATLTKKDFWFAVRWHIITQIIKTILCYPLALLIILGSWLTYPFWWLHEFFESF